MRTAFSILALALLIPAFAIAQTFPSSDLPTTEALHGMFEEGHYAELLQRLGRILALRPPAADSFNRYEMLMLKGDTHAQLKQASLAIDSYHLAVKSASNLTDAAAATMYAELLKRGKAFAFTPNPRNVAKGDPAGPFDLLNSDQHKKAMVALFNDEWAEAQRLLADAKKATQLGPVMDAAKVAANLRNAELAATSADDKSGAVLAALTDRAKSLMTTALKHMGDRTKEIGTSANEKVLLDMSNQVTIVAPGVAPQTPDPVYHKRGLDNGTVGELHDIIDTCDKIAPAVAELAPVLGADAKVFDEVVAAAQDLHAKAYDTLHADYTGIYATRD